MPPPPPIHVPSLALIRKFGGRGVGKRGVGGSVILRMSPLLNIPAHEQEKEEGEEGGGEQQPRRSAPQVMVIFKVLI
jgi:hypothetical protein